jgi:hypothetical protein
MEQSFPAHINSVMKMSPGRRHSAWKSDGTEFSCTHQFRNENESGKAAFSVEIRWNKVFLHTSIQE